MVSKITIFEPHFDGAQFGPASLPNDGDTDEPTAPAVEDTAQSTGRSRGRSILVGGAALSIALLIGFVAARRSLQPAGEAVEDERKPSIFEKAGM